MSKSKQAVVTLKTQAIELAHSMGLTAPTLKGFETDFMSVSAEREDNESKWVELSVVAPITFGEGCFTKEREKGEEWNEDYALLKETLEQAVCMAKYGKPMPEIVRVKPGTVLTASQEQERKMAQDVRAKVGTAINRMASYFAEQVGAEKQARKLPSLAAWCGTAVVTLAGKAETTKTKAVAPKVSGAVPQILVDLLACFTHADEADHAKAMESFRASVVAEDARIKSVQAIQAAQNRPRVAVKSDAPKAKAKAKA